MNYHSRAELECRTTLQPPIQAVWSRHHGTLPREAVTQKVSLDVILQRFLVAIIQSTLIIPSVREGDAGAYTCTATTEMGAMAEVFTILVVTGVVPYTSSTAHCRMPILTWILPFPSNLSQKTDLFSTTGTTTLEQRTSSHSD